MALIERSCAMNASRTEARVPDWRSGPTMKVGRLASPSPCRAATLSASSLLALSRPTTVTCRAEPSVSSSPSSRIPVHAGHWRPRARRRGRGWGGGREGLSDSDTHGRDLLLLVDDDLLSKAADLVVVTLAQNCNRHVDSAENHHVHEVAVDIA
jgi:hypothetical protein